LCAENHKTAHLIEFSLTLGDADEYEKLGPCETITIPYDELDCVYESPAIYKMRNVRGFASPDQYDWVQNEATRLQVPAERIWHTYINHPLNKHCCSES